MTEKQLQYYRDYFKRKRQKENPLIDKLCLGCGEPFRPISHRQKFHSPKCQRRWHKRSSRKIRKVVGKCEVCGFSVPEALESHHYTKRDLIVLCGSCHNIWHRLSKETHSLRDMVISTVSNHLLNSQNSLTNAPNFYQKSIKELLTTKGA